VNVSAFAHEGELAFVSRGSLWVLNGGHGTLRRLPVPAGDTPSSPSFSRDGRWLAYLTASQNGSSSEMWVAHGDGSAPRMVGRLAVDELVGWSPTADVLAVISATQTSPMRFPNGTSGTLERDTIVGLVAPTGGVRRLLTLPATLSGPRIYDAVWAPAGNSIAVATYEGFPSPLTTIRAYPLDGDPPTTWLVIRARQGLAGVCRAACGGVSADLAGWWSGWGIAFWALPGALAQTVDATALAVLASPGTTPRLIGRTLANGRSEEFAAPSAGTLALVESTEPTGREYTAGKAVEICTPASRSCAQLPGATTWSGAAPRFPCSSPCSQFHLPPAGSAGSAVSLDPAWSPSGAELAYVKAPATPTAENPASSWYQAHELLVWNTRTDTTSRIANSAGAIVPAWSRDGRELLYVSNDGLWLTRLSGGQPIEIEHPLFPEQQWRQVATNDLSFYGQIPWNAQFSWSSP
jgi:hypothetical protein